MNQIWKICILRFSVVLSMEIQARYNGYAKNRIWAGNLDKALAAHSDSDMNTEQGQVKTAVYFFCILRVF